MRLDNPLLVQWEYASEERLAKRNAILRALVQGENPEEEAFCAIAEAKPRGVLDVGCGTRGMVSTLRPANARVSWSRVAVPDPRRSATTSREVGEMLRDGVGETLSFNVRNGRARLERWLAHVEQHGVTAAIVFPRPEPMRTFAAEKAAA